MSAPSCSPFLLPLFPSRTNYSSSLCLRVEGQAQHMDTSTHIHRPECLLTFNNEQNKQKMSIDMNACYPALPGKESKAKCCPISSTQKYSSPSSNPEHGMESSLSRETETQPGVSQLPAPYQGDLGKLPGSGGGLCRSSLPAWARRKCHPAPTQRARWYLTAAAVKSCTRKNIFSCSWAVPRRLQSWSDTSLVHLPQSAG